jgi:hypothetical protein
MTWQAPVRVVYDVANTVHYEVDDMASTSP